MAKDTGNSPLLVVEPTGICECQGDYLDAILIGGGMGAPNQHSIPSPTPTCQASERGVGRSSTHARTENCPPGLQSRVRRRAPLPSPDATLCFFPLDPKELRMQCPACPAASRPAPDGVSLPVCGGVIRSGFFLGSPQSPASPPPGPAGIAPHTFVTKHQLGRTRATKVEAEGIKIKKNVTDGD